MFVDEVEIVCIAGKGGNGAVSWRREKYIPNGGPFGGDGGKGGNIIVRTSPNEHTLSDFRHEKRIVGKDGEKGGTKEMHGKNGEDTIILVPPGTIIRDTETREILYDLDRDGMEIVLCRGGRGGYGNAHFASSTRQAPHFAELGDTGEKKEVHLELQLVADVGLVGFPNAGKSTLISTITQVRPKIANYPFTTLVPHLGVMNHKEQSIVIEDVPGLIEGAHTGKGLGTQFLRHIERAGLIVHLIDPTSDDPIADYHTIREEFTRYSPTLAAKREIVILSKSDLIDTKDIEKLRKKLEKIVKTTVSVLSSHTHEGIDSFRDTLIAHVSEDRARRERERPTMVAEEEAGSKRLYDFKADRDADESYRIFALVGNRYEVAGKRLEEIVRMTDMHHPEAISRVYDVLQKQRIVAKVLALAEKRGYTAHENYYVDEKKTDDDFVDNEHTDNTDFGEEVTPDDSGGLPVIIIAWREFPLTDYTFRKGYGKRGY